MVGRKWNWLNSETITKLDHQRARIFGGCPVIVKANSENLHSHPIYHLLFMKGISIPILTQITRGRCTSGTWELIRRFKIKIVILSSHLCIVSIIRKLILSTVMNIILKINVWIHHRYNIKFLGMRICRISAVFPRLWPQNDGSCKSSGSIHLRCAHIVSDRIMIPWCLLGNNDWLFRVDHLVTLAFVCFVGWLLFFFIKKTCSFRDTFHV